jgi:small subunit ribosomal protein S4
MSRNHGPKCKLCRREGVKLFLKGMRCQTAKCAMEGRGRPPGMRRFPRRRASAYRVRLREKQKCKRYYGVLEAQFRRYFERAAVGRGNTGENLLQLLERRLDNVLAVCGFALSRAQARQMITHQHVQVNGHTVDRPSYLLDEGDVVRPEPADEMLGAVRVNRETAGHPGAGWLEVNDSDLTIRCLRMPVREDVTLDVEEGLVVEFCSR